MRQQMRSTKSVDLIGHIKFLPWGQLNGCSVPLSAKGVTCETSSVASTLLVYMSIGKYSVHCKTTKKCLFPSDSEGLTPQMGTSFTKIQGIVAPQFQKSASYIFNRLTYVNKLTQMLFSQ